MKYFCIFSLILLGFRSESQNDTVRIYQIYSSFSNQEKAEWTSFENNWNYFQYSEIKKKLKVKKLNCSNCTNLFADIYLEINSDGKVIKAIFINGKKCGVICTDKLFIELFEKSVLHQQYTALKNKRFIARFGNALKC